MKKLFKTTILLALLATASAFGEDTQRQTMLDDDAYKAAAKLTDKAKAALADIMKTPIPDSLPDISHLGVTWENWKKIRAINLLQVAAGDRSEAVSDNAREISYYRRYQVVFGFLAPLDLPDPFTATPEAKPKYKEDEFLRHGWRAIRALMSAKVADEMLDWILPDFKKIFDVAPPEAQITYRMAVKSALSYLQTVDFKTEDEYFKKLQAGTMGYGLAEYTFSEYRPDGSDRPFTKVETFLYRRWADKSFTKEEMIALVKKIDTTMVAWGKRK